MEIKAHLPENSISSTRAFFENYKDSVFCGNIEKCDIYWAKSENDVPLFRTRLEKTDNEKRILVTSKPLKKKEYKTEYNVENEFCVGSSEWDRIIGFAKGLGLEICRRKWKKGFGFTVPVNGYIIHAEILEVKFLGWFLEMEICAETEDSLDKEDAQSALFELYDMTGLPKNLLEPTGYNKMLAATGHERG